MTKINTLLETTYSLVAISGRNISITHIITQFEDGLATYAKYKCFGKSCRVTVREKVNDFKPCIYIDSSDNDLSVSKEIKKQWGIISKPNTNIIINITQQDFDMIKAVEAEYNRPYKEAEAAKKAQQDSMPKYYIYSEGTDWGDYSISTYQDLIVVRDLTPQEIENGRKGYSFVEKLSSQTVHPSNVGIDIQSLTKVSYKDVDDAYLLTEAQANLVLDATMKRNAEKLAKDIAEKAEKEAKAKAKREAEAKKSEESRINAEENELFIFSAGVVYSQAGNSMLHSLGAIFGENIEVYTTNYANNIPSANTTYSIKETLKSEGFSFNSSQKNWTIPNTPENQEKVLALLKKYDTKVWPSSIGFVRCWECGTYSHRSKMEMDGPGYYCGC